MADTNVGGQRGAPQHGTPYRASPTLTPQGGLARSSRRVLANCGALDSSGRALAQRWSSVDAAPACFQRHLVRVTNGMPMENDAARVWFWFSGTRPFPEVGAARSVWATLEALPERIRRVTGDRLGVAGGRQCDGIRPCKRGDCVGKNPTDRAKLGTKRHLHVDRHGIPLAVSLSGANDHDKTQLRTVLDARVVERPSPSSTRQHLCLDKGYDYPDIRLNVWSRGYVGHIPHRGEKPRMRKKHPARRWVVERTNRWHNLFRRLKIRYEVHAQNYLGFVQFACAIICFRRARAT